MTQPPPNPSSATSPSRAGARLRAWLREHRPVAYGGAAAAGVAGIALYRRHKAGAGGTGPGATSGTTPGGYTAGLSGDPNTLASDIENQVQDQLNQALHNLPDPTPVTSVPKPPRPLPRPGHDRYKIRKGDTLASILMAVYGTTAKWAEHALKRANPTLSTFDLKDKLNHFAGHTITVPKAHRPDHEPPPHPPHRPDKPPRKQPPAKQPAPRPGRRPGIHA